MMNFVAVLVILTKIFVTFPDYHESQIYEVKLQQSWEICVSSLFPVKIDTNFAEK
jgi:hypothetical protein